MVDVESYRRVARAIDEETKIMSSVADIVNTFLQSEIANIGREFIPLMLDDIRRSVGSPHWRFYAIVEIAKRDGLPLPVIPEEDKGKILAIAAIFQAWGEEHGFTASS